MDSPQQVCETYPAFQNKVFEMALDPDPVMVGVALDTLGLLGTTVEGKQVLQKTGLLVSCLFSQGVQVLFSRSKRISSYICGNCLSGSLCLTPCLSVGEKFKAILVRMSQHASSGATELRVRSLDAIAQLLSLEVCVKTFKCFIVSLNTTFRRKGCSIHV